MTYEYETLDIVKDGRLAVVTINNPPINVITMPLYMDLMALTEELAPHADIVLPDTHHMFEKWGYVKAMGNGYRHVTLMQPIIEPVGDYKIDETEIPWLIAEKLNERGFGNLLEGCRHNGVKHLVYASSSSVYGANTDMPFSVHDNVDHPLSLYAASKKANELMAHTYSHLYDLPTTGLRFFTVYGPFGRPDMALFMFTKNILEGKPIVAVSARTGSGLDELRAALKAEALARTGELDTILEAMLETLKQLLSASHNR